MNIEKIQETDLDQFKSFKNREYSQVDRDHYGDPLPDFDKHEFTFVAKVDGHIEGYITVFLELGVALIKSLLVGSDFQRRGIATQLVERAEHEAKKLGAHKIWLETGAEWNARKLYESLGYTNRCTFKNFYGHQDFIFFDKEL